MSSNSTSFLSFARGGGWFLLNTAAAVLAPAILESPFYHLIPAHSGRSVILKAWCLSVLFAAVIGFFAFRKWRNSTASLAWVLPILWFSFGVLATSSTPHASLESLWFRFSGIECAKNFMTLDCRAFFVFTISLIRGVSYSLGAWLAAYSSHLRPAGSAIAG